MGGGVCFYTTSERDLKGWSWRERDFDRAPKSRFMFDFVMICLWEWWFCRSNQKVEKCLK